MNYRLERLTEKVEQEGETIVSFEADYPAGTGSGAADRYFERSARQLLRTTRGKIAKKARERYVECARTGEKFKESRVLQRCSCTQRDGLFCCVANQSFNLSGRSVYSLRHADTFELKTGRLLSFGELFKKNPRRGALKEITRQIERRRKAGDDSLYKNCISRARRRFNSDNYYLSDEGVTVFYERLDLAGPAAGSPEFAIPYAKLPERVFV